MSKLYRDRTIARMHRQSHEENGHWRFTGSINHAGYGRMRYKGKMISTSRLSAHLFLGLDLNSEKELACHKEDICLFKDCWNPDHLYVGNVNSNKFDFQKRVTHCPQGHEYTEGNTYVYGLNRLCFTCITNRNKAKAARVKQLQLDE